MWNDLAVFILGNYSLQIMEYLWSIITPITVMLFTLFLFFFIYPKIFWDLSFYEFHEVDIWFLFYYLTPILFIIITKHIITLCFLFPVISVIMICMRRKPFYIIRIMRYTQTRLYLKKMKSKKLQLNYACKNKSICKTA